MYKIYIDGVHYLDSDNDTLRSHIIDKIEDWTVTVNTSGTTGHPKKVTHSKKVSQTISEYNAEWFGLKEQSRMLSLYSPRGIAFTVMSLYPSLIANSELYIETDVSAKFIDRVNQLRPTHGLILPNLWRVLHKHRNWKNLDLSSYEQCIVGSDYTAEGCLEDLKDKGAQSVYNVYGSTEVPPNVMTSSIPNTYTLDSNPHVDIKIVDNEIHAKWKVQKDWWKSGDLVEETDNGYKLVGRKYNMFKLGECGIRIYPEQVEKIAVSKGADLALCRLVNDKCTIYYTGNVIEKEVLDMLDHKARMIKVNEIKVDTNLRKIDRTQTF
jgi:acyl-coenzyme A synthetase/AMP-(fatty) acid ligase